MKIVADEKIPFLKGVFETYADIKYLPGDEISSADLAEANILLTRSITTCNAELLKNSGIKLIATATIGDDHIDKRFCLENDIKWETAKGCNVGAVEQYFTAALLEIAAKEQITLKEKTIGIIGVGEIGSAVAKIAEQLGMKVLLNDPPREEREGPGQFTSLAQIQQETDIISLHVPLTFGGNHKTFHLLGEDFFMGLSKSVVLINTSRGSVVETEVLKKAFREGKIKKFAIDVWENEPDIDTDLLQMADIATPHIAGYSMEGKANGTAMVVHAVSEYFVLGIDDWYPQISRSSKNIKLDCTGIEPQEVYRMALNAVYPIYHDVLKLKTSPDQFEELRGDYVFRHENSAFDLELINPLEEIKSTLKIMGFQIKQ